jgi:hypothetical protein
MVPSKEQEMVKQSRQLSKSCVVIQQFVLHVAV